MVNHCKNCVLPTNYLNIQIDQYGICNHCRSFEQTKFLGKDKLLSDIQEALKLNTSKKYDCVVGFSGGRDSTYLLWYVVRILKLRALAVFSDDLFIPQIALDNIKTTCEVLNVDVRMIKHDNLKKCLPHHLKAWIKRPVAETLMFINVGERIGYETLVEKEAIKEGVKLIFGGRTPIQSAETYKKELMLFKYREGRFHWPLGYLLQVIRNPSLALNLFCLKTQFKEYRVTKWKEKLIKEHSLKIVHPFYEYVHWIEKDIEHILFNELKWAMPEGSNNSSRFGCEVDTLRQYLYYRTLGYNDSHVDLSFLIRDKQLSREEAFEKLESSIDIPDAQIKDILTKAGIDADDFMKKLNIRIPRHKN